MDDVRLSACAGSGKDYIQGEIRALGPMGNEEKKVAWVFLAVALLWMTRSERLLGADIDISGWSHLARCGAGEVRCITSWGFCR